MPATDRLHGLDTVRAIALLLGIALHAAQPFIAGLPWIVTDTPSDTLAGAWYTIHMFRMPLFFFIAGFFGRMLLERRGVSAFVRDRSLRILVPLVVGLPIVMLACGLAIALGSLATGGELASVRPPASASSPPRGWLASIQLIHLWFLYYLALFYVGALIARSACSAVLGTDARLNGIDAMVRFLMRGAWAPTILALPIAAYYVQLPNWSSWGGLPAPFSVIPDAGALVAYGSFFCFGWLLHRQRPLLTSLATRCTFYGALALAAWAVCLTIGGTTPHWGPYLEGARLAVYTTTYVFGAWCFVFALIGLALRFFDSESRVRRYLADSSYWLYLMHIPALFFFNLALHPLSWHWSLKYSLTVAGTIAILLLSYHYCVRYTAIGVVLNGARRPRFERSSVLET